MHPTFFEKTSPAHRSAELSPELTSSADSVRGVPGIACDAGTRATMRSVKSALVEATPVVV